MNILNYPFVSIIIPVRNEALILSRCLKSLKNLDYPEERLEIIVADGLSEDNTAEIASRYGARVVKNERRIVSSGRNAGFRESKGDIIAFTDADCVFDKCWLKAAVKYFNDESIGGVGGLTLPPLDSCGFEKAVDNLFSFAESFNLTCHCKGVSLHSPKKTEDIPGCNAFYRRQILEMIFPVDENLLTAEDCWMNFCVRDCGYQLILAPDIILWHNRRDSPRKFLRQIYRFAVGRMQLGRKNFKLLNITHIISGFAIPLFLLIGYSFYSAGAGAVFLKIFFYSFIMMTSAASFKAKSLVVGMISSIAAIIFIFGWSAGFLREFFLPLKDAKGK